VLAGRSPFAADNRHLHHRLLGLGFDHYEAVAVIYGLQCLLLLLAWQLRFASDLLILATFVALVFLLVTGIGLLEHRGWRWRKRPGTEPSPVTLTVSWLAAEGRLRRWAMRVAGLCTAAYWLAVACFSREIPADVPWLAAGAMLLLLAALRWRRSELVNRWLMRGALYVAVMTAVYLDHYSPHREAVLQVTKFVFLPLLAVSVAIAVRLSQEKRFGATPLDLLLIFCALALPNLPGVQSATADLGISIAKLFALSYAVELIATLGSRLRTALQVAGVVFFAVVATRGWLML
jgi:UDP-GlcNAc:undecaprenyl-phosphate GlcNAc-1-phosphate transferase